MSDLGFRRAKNDSERCTTVGGLGQGRCVLVYGHLHNHVYEVKQP